MATADPPRLALLVNVRSGAGHGGRVATALRQRLPRLEVFGLDDGERVLAAGPQRILVAGGDGSLGFAAKAAAAARVPLGVVPVGTANDFARAMGIPSDADEALELAVGGTETTRVDLARMGERPFLNVASIGLPPAAAQRARGWKRALGPLAYAIGALRAGIAADPVECLIQCDGELFFSGRAWQATVACSGAFGAGSEVVADPSDGRLDVVVIEAGSRARLMLRAYGLRTGTVASQRGVRAGRASVVELEVPEPTSYNVDGELLRAGSTRFEIESGAVEVVTG